MSESQAAFFRRAGRPSAHWTDGDDRELLERLRIEAQIDGVDCRVCTHLKAEHRPECHGCGCQVYTPRVREPEPVAVQHIDVYHDVDGPRSGSSFVRRLEDGLE